MITLSRRLDLDLLQNKLRDKELSASRSFGRWSLETQMKMQGKWDREGREIHKLCGMWSINDSVTGKERTTGLNSVGDTLKLSEVCLRRPTGGRGGKYYLQTLLPSLCVNPIPTPVQWLPTCLGYSNFYGTGTSSYTQEKRDSSSWGKKLSKWGNKCYSIFSWMHVSHGLQGPLAMKGMCCGEG